MAKKTSSESTPKTGYKLVCCLNCVHAHLHQYDRNPILSACHKRPQPDNERFPYEVEVACHLRRCSDWTLSTERKEVEHRSKAV